MSNTEHATTNRINGSRERLKIARSGSGCRILSVGDCSEASETRNAGRDAIYKTGGDADDDVTS